MKNLLLIFSVLLSTSLFAVEYGYITMYDTPNAKNYITLNDGDVLEILNNGTYSGLNNSNIYLLETNIDAENLDFKSNSYWDTIEGSIIDRIDQTQFSDIRGTMIAGPGIVIVGDSSSNNPRHTFHYKLTRASEYLNSNTFSIVNNTETSTHNIVVETSTDLENWTPVHSSGLTGSSEQIYVRTRISTSE